MLTNVLEAFKQIEAKSTKTQNLFNWYETENNNHNKNEFMRIWNDNVPEYHLKDSTIKHVLTQITKLSDELMNSDVHDYVSHLLELSDMGGDVTHNYTLGLISTLFYELEEHCTCN